MASVGGFDFDRARRVFEAGPELRENFTAQNAGLALDDLLTMLRTNIDRGQPVIFSLPLKNQLEQEVGAHMNVALGYTTNTNGIIAYDPAGAWFRPGLKNLPWKIFDVGHSKRLDASRKGLSTNLCHREISIIKAFIVCSNFVNTIHRSDVKFATSLTPNPSE